MSERIGCAGCTGLFTMQDMMIVDGLAYCERCNPLIEKVKPETEAAKLFGHPRFYEILKQMEELHSRKNHDYAGTSDPLKNLRACERLELKPFIGVMVRLQDKWSRLEEFVKSGTLMVKGESVIDTLMDNAVYSVLAIILYEEQQKIEEENYNAAIDHETSTGAETTPGYGGNIQKL